MNTNNINETADNIQRHISYFDAETTLFAAKPSRLSLINLKLPTPSGNIAHINVWRNHAFESLVTLTEPYFSYGELIVNFRLNSYDDSLDFTGHSIAAVELLWLDSSRYLKQLTINEWSDWLAGRIQHLRTLSRAPIVLATWIDDNQSTQSLMDMCDSIPGVYFAELANICESAGVSLLDERSYAFAGTPISGPAQTILARSLACHWLPGLLSPPVKAIALDLDNTLHKGILGEDGIQGVQLTAGHKQLQKSIKQIQQRGIYIALVSRNEKTDVEALFTKRSDYILRLNDFSALEVSWENKADALVRIANSLRIATDAILFVDDNIGELAHIINTLPSVRVIQALNDAALTSRAINYYPGLWRWKASDDDTKRVSDLNANISRKALYESTGDPSAYLRSLQVTLTFFHNPRDKICRLADLSNKTNQFNLAISRFNEADLAEQLERGNASVVAIQMSDRLSDSGVIGVIIAERQGNRLIVEELCISCRAIGRQLEDHMIILAIRTMPIFNGCNEVAFRVRLGQRNQPALTWLSSLLNAPPLSPGVYTVTSELLDQFAPDPSVLIINN